MTATITIPLDLRVLEAAPAIDRNLVDDTTTIDDVRAAIDRLVDADLLVAAPAVGFDLVNIDVHPGRRGLVDARRDWINGRLLHELNRSHQPDPERVERIVTRGLYDSPERLGIRWCPECDNTGWAEKGLGWADGDGCPRCVRITQEA